MPHSLELIAFDAVDLGVLIGIVGLVFAFTENRRARRAEGREQDAEIRAVRAEQRAEAAYKREQERQTRDDRIAALERVGELVREVRDATQGMLVSDAASIAHQQSAIARLTEAVEAAPVDLPRCRRIAGGEAMYGTAEAEAEVEQAIARERSTGP